MDEEIWSIYDHRTGRETILRRTDPRQYELFMTEDLTGCAIAQDLDRKNLKDLWNAIGNEIGAFNDPVAPPPS